MAEGEIAGAPASVGPHQEGSAADDQRLRPTDDEKRIFGVGQVAIDPDDALQAIDLGLLREKQGDPAAAAAAYQVAIDSGDFLIAPVAALNLGLLREKQGDPAAAAAAYQLAIDFGQAGVAFAAAAFSLGALRKKQGDFAAAAAAYQLATNAGEPPALEMLQEEQGDPAVAAAARDARVLAAGLTALAPPLADAPAEHEATDGPHAEPLPVQHSPVVRRNAARLRLVTDRKQGKTSPDWVYKLAGETRPA
ncbi:hypothetical protein [Angustibacter aerolatus]